MNLPDASGRGITIGLYEFHRRKRRAIRPFALLLKGKLMAHELDPNEIVDSRELVMTNTIQVDTMYRLLIYKGYFTKAEFLAKMKEVQRDYHGGGE